MSTPFEMQPEFMEALTDAHEAASAGITGALTVVTPAQMSLFSMSLGAIAVGNMIPVMYETTGNNVASAAMTAAKYGAMSAATHSVDAIHTAVDGAVEA